MDIAPIVYACDEKNFSEIIREGAILSTKKMKERGKFGSTAPCFHNLETALGTDNEVTLYLGLWVRWEPGG